MSIVNRYFLNLDLKRRYTSDIPKFRRGDSGELIFRLFDDGVELDLSSATDVKLYQRTPTLANIESACEIIELDGRKVVRYKYEDIAMVELGYNTLLLVVFEGSKAVSIQPFSVIIYDDLQGRAGTYLTLIGELLNKIKNKANELTGLIKLSEKGSPNGVATLNSAIKLIESQLPDYYHTILNHVNKTIFKDNIHGMKINDDGILQHLTSSGYVDTIIAKPKIEYGEVTALISVSEGDVTVTFYLDNFTAITLRKWDKGDRDIAHFASNGIEFTDKFKVDEVGTYTIYYKTYDGREGIKKFNVTQEMLPTPIPELKASVQVINGVSTITYTGLGTASISVQKWAKGYQTKDYFATNGTQFTGNSYNVDEIGEYTLYYKSSDGREGTLQYEVTQEMLPTPPKPDITASIVVTEGIATVAYNNLEGSTITLQKQAKEQRTIEYFESNGTIFTENTFEITEVGTYTIYFKADDDRQGVTVFEVTQEMLPEEVPTDNTPPSLNITLSGAYGDGTKTGAVLALVRVKDDESGISHMILPNGDRVDNPNAYSEHKFTTNGTYMFRVYNNAGLYTDNTITVSNIGTATKISQMPLGTRFSFCGYDMVVIEKSPNRNTIVQYNTISNYNAIAYDNEGSTNEFQTASISHFLNNSIGLYDTLGGENNVLEDGQWNYGFIYYDNAWIQYDNKYATNRTGLLTVPQFDNALKNNWINVLEGEEEWSISPGTTGNVYVVSKNNQLQLTAYEKAVVTAFNYRYAYQVDDDAVGYR